MINFCAIDFETATHERHSACEIGICVVENSQIVKKESWLIKPPSFPYFNHHNIAVHGISPFDVEDAPTFDEVWVEVAPTLSQQLLIAHNASFDAGVLRACLDYYHQEKPNQNYLCSIQVAKKSWEGLPSYSLGQLAHFHNIKFNHHRAGDDAEVCAKITLMGLEKLMVNNMIDVNNFFQKNIKLL